MNIQAEMLSIDCEQEVKRISSAIKKIVVSDYRKRGVVVALSGGVDSSVCAALAVNAFGKNKVLALLLPEQDSSKDITDMGQVVAERLGIKWIRQDISPVLDAIGCYQWRDDAIKEVFPEYDGTWKNKITIHGSAKGGFHFFHLVVQTPDGEILEKRLSSVQYLQIVAATNYKQRIRKTIEYFHADRLNYAVIGTPNRLEYDQGFFVKNGDGSADIKPIAHLYKTQVYALARHFELPKAVCSAEPTTDTYSLAQSQDEFYFSLPYQQMDVALWAYKSGRPAAECADLIGTDEATAEKVYADIEGKRRATRYLHEQPRLLDG